ncbi:MAG: poly(3-hydroxybutyrate) depolymerase [Nitrospira sp.]|nr:MAG: poly(3-hydroxybutyrate) depolymerase [Nitrospira sp.]
MYTVRSKWIGFGEKRPGCPMSTAIALILLVVGFSEAGEVRAAGMNDVEAVPPANVLSEAAYLVSDVARQCEPGTKSGRAGGSDDEKTASGIRYMVKTPVNYHASIAHPLLMVYAPARTNRYASEDFVHLTQEATAAGFIVAYADHRTMSSKSIEELAAIPGLIEQKWCVDHTRIVLTGHSDGGTTAMAIAFLDGTKHIPAAIAPSAMGIRGEDLKAYQCPDSLPVMLMHSSQDRLFPGYGKEAIQWWVSCNGCEATPPVKDADGCVTYRGCKNNVTTRYCEGTGSHTTWPGNNKAIIEFFRGSQDLR